MLNVNGNGNGDGHGDVTCKQNLYSCGILKDEIFTFRTTEAASLLNGTVKSTTSSLCELIVRAATARSFCYKKG